MEHVDARRGHSPSFTSFCCEKTGLCLGGGMVDAGARKASVARSATLVGSNPIPRQRRKRCIRQEKH